MADDIPDFLKPLRTCGWVLIFLLACASPLRAQDTELTSVRQIRALTVKEATQGVPVRIRGIVTFSRTRLATLFIHDGDKGIFVQQPIEYNHKGPQLGDRVEVTGITGEGLFAPVIRGVDDKGAKIEIIGKGDPPIPKTVTDLELPNPDMDCEWVTVDALVVEVLRIGDGVVLQCKTGTYDFYVVVEGPIPPSAVPWNLTECRVRIRGVVATAFNTGRQMTRRLVRMSSLADVQTLDQGPKSPEPPKSARVDELFRIEGPGPGEMVRLRGNVTLTIPGRGLYIHTPEGGLWVQTSQPFEAPPGTLVEADGFPRLGAMKPFLRARTLQVTGHGSPPPPQRLNAWEARHSKYDSELVSVDAELFDVAPGPEGTTLVLRDSGVVFYALLRSTPGTGLSKLEIGSRLRIAGIAQITTSNIFSPLQEDDKLLVLLRSPEDVLLLSRPPWLTTRIVILLAAAVIAAMLAVYAVARAKRRREEETKHREFEAVLAERGRFAREIHDSLAQGLTSISLQLECVRDEITGDDSKLRSHIETARRLVRDSLREARRTIWNLRPLALGEADLASALQRYAADLTRDGGISTSQEIEGTPRPIPLDHEAALLRIGQEALTNAVRHSSPTLVLLRLRYGPEWVTVTVRDNGRGFDVAAKARKGFGLTGMHERVAAIGGSLSIDSIPGEGTEVSATLPT